jgi:hypothetical protein
LTVAANSGAARSARMIVGDAVFTLTQAAASPAPAPAPAPVPAPVPSPSPAPTTVQLSGDVSGLSGQCPGVAFTVGSTSVFAIGSTNYLGGKCKDLRNGRAVAVSGTVQADRRVLASVIDLSN